MTSNSSPLSPIPTGGAPPEPFQAQTLSASLSVKDLHKSLGWYRDVVGFTVDKEYEREGVLRAVALKAGTVRVLINADDGARGADRVKGGGFSLYFTTTQNVDEIAKRITDLGGTLASPPADTPWGPRVFRVQDPDGFMLVIASEG